MLDLVNGLPVHALVVHAVVVLLPLGCLGTLAMAVHAPWRARYGGLVVAVSAVATVLIPVATASGEELERRVGDPGAHAELGDQLIWFAIPLTLFAAALWWLDRRSTRGEGTDRGRTLVRVAAGLALVAAVASSVQVYRVGDSGARAAWGDRVSGGGESAGH